MTLVLDDAYGLTHEVITPWVNQTVLYTYCDVRLSPRLDVPNIRKGTPTCLMCIARAKFDDVP